MLQEVGDSRADAHRLDAGSPVPFVIGELPLAGAVRRALARRGTRPVLLGGVTARPEVHTAAGWALHLDPGVETALPGRLVQAPAAPVALLGGPWDRRSVRVWEQAVTSTLTLVRMLPAMSGRRVVALGSVLSTVPLPIDDAEILSRCDALAAEPGADLDQTDDEACRSQLFAGWARRLIDVGPGPDGEAEPALAHALILRANELLLRRAVPASELTLLRVDELIGEPDQARPAGLLEQLLRRARAGLPLRVRDRRHGFVAVADLAEVVAAALSSELTGLAPGADLAARTVTWRLPELADLLAAGFGSTSATVVQPDFTRPATVIDLTVGDGFAALLASTGVGRGESGDQRVARQVHELVQAEVVPVHPAVQVVVPPRPERPDQVGHRMAAALYSGSLKHGGPWTARLTEALRETLDLPADRALLLTASGSAALRLAAVALAGPAGPGQVAVLPSYTFAATGEILAQLGYGLRFYDVDPGSWTPDPVSAELALAAGNAALLVTVDALGNPTDFARMSALAGRFGVPLLADSAPSLGALAAGRPIGGQADAHVFSMSFAKVVSAGGAGGALVVPAAALARLTGPVDWTRSALMPELAAIAALDQLERLGKLQQRRAAVAAVYDEVLAGLDGVQPQRVRAGDRHAYVHWAARFRDRSMAGRLAGLGIGTRNYYGPVLHRVPWPGPRLPGPPLPVTELLAAEVLALPMSSELTLDVAEQVAGVVRSVVTRRGTGDGGR